MKPFTRKLSNKFSFEICDIDDGLQLTVYYMGEMAYSSTIHCVNDVMKNEMFVSHFITEREQQNITWGSKLINWICIPVDNRYVETITVYKREEGKALTIVADDNNGCLFYLRKNGED